MKVLLSNDDGVNAPGIHALYSVLKKTHESTMIAPLEERSTTGHSLSLDRPLRLEKISPGIYGCSGFPADCVLMGLGHVLKGERRPDVVVSGINRGANLAQDLYYSGTIAAAREAAFHGVSAIAVSLHFDQMTEHHHYETAARFIEMCLRSEIHKALPPLHVLNINVPNLPLQEIQGCRLTEIGFRNYSEAVHSRVDARGREYFWIAGIYEGFESNAKSDCQAISEGLISLTPHALIDRPRHEYTELRKLTGNLNAELNS